jgi:predicted RNA-binding protein with TRAM domain
MIEIPDTLRSLFTGRIRKQDGNFVIEVPRSELDNDAVAAGERYRVAILDAAPPESSSGTDTVTTRQSSDDPPTPPVDEGEVRTVSVEAIGDQGDGIAKVERGYVVIVPDAAPGDQPTVEIEEVQQNVAFARVVDGDRPH